MISSVRGVKGEKPMNNAFARQLTQAKNKGIEHGLKGMAMMATIALDNVLKDHTDDVERSAIIHEFDAEVYRVWQEFKTETIAKNTDINELIVGYYERLMNYGHSEDG